MRNVIGLQLALYEIVDTPGEGGPASARGFLTASYGGADRGEV